MDFPVRVNLKKEKRLEKVNLYLPTKIYMKVILKMEKEKEMEN